jgi:hypothetical protein
MKRTQDSLPALVQPAVTTLPQRASRRAFLSASAALIIALYSTTPAAPIRMRLMATALANPAQHGTRFLEMTELKIGRQGHTATELADGRILVVGGENEDGPVSEAEIYDPAAGGFAAKARSLEARSLHTAILLADGREAAIRSSCVRAPDVRFGLRLGSSICTTESLH